jgi:hypothetical protein
MRKPQGAMITEVRFVAHFSFIPVKVQITYVTQY